MIEMGQCEISFGSIYQSYPVSHYWVFQTIQVNHCNVYQSDAWCIYVIYHMGQATLKQDLQQCIEISNVHILEF